MKIANMKIAGMKIAWLALALALIAGPAAAQVVPPPAKPGSEAVQHGAQPNPDDVRPGNRDGDSPSASAGDLLSRPGRRILGLPISSALVLAGALLTLLILAGVVIPASSRRRRARGGGTYGRP